MKAVIFDLDGTLTNTINAIAHFGNTALHENGFGDIDTETYKYLVGDGRTVLIHRMLQYHNADTEENFQKVCKTYDFYYESDPLYDTDAYDGIRKILKELKRLGIKTAVCSNKPSNVVHDVVLKVFGENVFDFVYGATDEMPTKPNPLPALYVAQKLGVEPKDCIFTGDTNVDILTAKNAGMLSIGVLWGFRDFEELKKAGADYIISNPSEYLNYINM